MASIDIRNFVDVNILYKKKSEIKASRDTVVLFTDDPFIFTDTPETVTEYMFSSFEEVVEIYTDMSSQTVETIEASPNTYPAYHYAKVYFENGGIKLHVIQIDSPKIVSGDPNTYIITDINDKLNALPDEEIVVALAGKKQIAPDETEESFGWKNQLAWVSTMAKNYNNLATSYGVKQKIFLGVSPLEKISGYTDLENVQDISNLAVKLGDITNTSLNNTMGCEMTIAAYLSKINVYNQGSILDYCYTEENIEVIEDEDIDYNAVIQRAFNYNGNVDVELSEVIRNIGGNLTNGEDLVNKYTLIILHQTLSQAVFNTLTQKLKGNSGIAALYATISEELNKYLTSGYLTIDKVWKYNDLTIVKNNKQYTLIKKGTALLQGYQVIILPLSSLTEEEKQQRKAPYIYVVLADSYGIRKVAINGEVI